MAPQEEDQDRLHHRHCLLFVADYCRLLDYDDGLLTEAFFSQAGAFGVLPGITVCTPPHPPVPTAVFAFATRLSLLSQRRRFLARYRTFSELCHRGCKPREFRITTCANVWAYLYRSDQVRATPIVSNAVVDKRKFMWARLLCIWSFF